MLRLRVFCCALLLVILAAIPGTPADPPPLPISLNPLKIFKPSPFSAEAEVYAGGITGDQIGAGFQSLTQGAYGARFTFGFLKGINFTLDYMYSNQDRLFTAVTPATAILPSGVLLMRAANLNMGFGSGEVYFLQTKRSKFYISPGVGFVRNGGRSMTFVTPLGSASSPILPGTAVTFNLGAGMKIYPGNISASASTSVTTSPEGERGTLTRHPVLPRARRALHQVASSLGPLSSSGRFPFRTMSCSPSV